MRPNIEIGGVYAQNKVLEKLEGDYFLVECLGCGYRRRVWQYNILRTKACRKCAQRKGVPRTLNGKATKEYVAYTAMLARCLQTMPSWKERYGDTTYAGMEIEPRWLGPSGFDNFYEDVGPSPENFVLDRKDNNAGYLRENVRWTNVTQSNRNKSNIHLITAFGLTQPLQDWADDLGVPATTIVRRIKLLSWSPEDAVSKRPSDPRPTNDYYYMQIAGRVALRSTCIRRAVGCILTDKHNYVLSTGYNASPTGTAHCLEQPCAGASAASGERLDECRSRHAESVALMKCQDINAILKCYVTVSPCINCASMLLDSSCQEIVFAEPYADSETVEIFWKQHSRIWTQLEIED